MSNFDEKAVDRIKKLEREVERLRVKERPGIWLDWTPTPSWAGGADPISLTINSARYSQVGKIVHFAIKATLVVGTGSHSILYLTAPVTIKTGILPAISVSSNVVTGSYLSYVGFVDPSAAITVVFGFAIASDGNIFVSGTYEAA